MEAVHGRLSFLFNPLVVTAIVLFAPSGFVPLVIEIDNPHEILTKPFHAIRANIWLLVEVMLSYFLLRLPTSSGTRSPAITLAAAYDALA